jgi:hypothetical protein
MAEGREKGATTFSRMTYSIMTKGLFVTHRDTVSSCWVTIFYCYAECRYSKCRHPECSGAKKMQLKLRVFHSISSFGCENAVFELIHVFSSKNDEKNRENMLLLWAQTFYRHNLRMFVIG